MSGGPAGPQRRAVGSEPATTSTSDRAVALRQAIRRAGETDVERPSFSPDGGVTVHGPETRRARLQPLGQRTRISLSDGGTLVGEAEVDSDTLVAAIDARGATYDAAADALAVENGRPG
ncbi:hypothetical protein [Actinomycetospora sp. NBRC 106378]|uniref:hypothetical protein n=1 Tax=Actinomycetospora sp. NBRC 106378 TaxID=3032208 RepID=UPI0024A2EEB3|nr:hypothetical protein [Actinomycetospora sp. NBRC 106378]GLZ55958.1 hypothetical protein Acsp07_55750 [Actinomycetospora sp. NBRC 106378]